MGIRIVEHHHPDAVIVVQRPIIFVFTRTLVPVMTLIAPVVTATIWTMVAVVVLVTAAVAAVIV